MDLLTLIKSILGFAYKLFGAIGAIGIFYILILIMEDLAKRGVRGTYKILFFALLIIFSIAVAFDFLPN